jgi:hypothetical protein
MQKIEKKNYSQKESRFQTDPCIKQLKEHCYLTNKKGYIQKSVFRTLEGYNYRNLLALKLYIEDIIVDLREKKDERLSKWVEQLNIISSILNVQEDRYYFLHQGYFYRWCGYGYTTRGNSGRLYGFNASPQRLKRTVRFLLFGDYYTDIDISNAHPSFLLEFSKSVGLCTPVLEEFVSSREHFQEQVAKELNCKFKECKVAILKLLNQTRAEASKVLKESYTLSRLFEEVVLIREVLLCTYPDEARLADLVARKISPEKRAVSNTAYYLQNRETYYLLKLKEWFEKVWRKEGLLQNNLNATEEGLLLFIPMFDGALVRYFKGTTHASINDIVDAFNDKHLYVKFKVKPLEIEPDLLDKEGFQRYLVLLDFLSSVNATTSLSLLKHFNVNKNIVDDKLLVHIKTSSISLKDRIKTRELDIKRIKKNRGQATSKILTETLNKKLEGLYQAQRADSFYKLSKSEKVMLSDRIQYCMSKVRKGLLEYCDSSESLNEFVSLITKPQTGIYSDKEGN